MNGKRTKRPLMGRLLGTFKVGGTVAALSLAAVLGWSTFSLEGGGPAAEQTAAKGDHSGWGSEVLESIHEQAVAPADLIAQGLIRPANACGLGASSCFRCHDGGRAQAPPEDPETAPWHIDHAPVNDSCVGCHQGNDRLMRQQMAHRDLVANPLEAPGQSCASCHSADEVDDLLAVYLEAAATAE